MGPSDKFRSCGGKRKHPSKERKFVLQKNWKFEENEQKRKIYSLRNEFFFLSRIIVCIIEGIKLTSCSIYEIKKSISNKKKSFRYSFLQSKRERERKKEKEVKK